MAHRKSPEASGSFDAAHPLPVSAEDLVAVVVDCRHEEEQEPRAAETSQRSDIEAYADHFAEARRLLLRTLKSLATKGVGVGTSLAFALFRVGSSRELSFSFDKLTQSVTHWNNGA